jgi:CarD family transcriptional regulator
MKILGQDSTEMSMNWNKRYRDNMDKLKTGDICEVADIVRNLSFKQKDKGLSTGEKKMLLNAKQILVSELVLVESKDKEEVEEYVDNTINTSYELHGFNEINGDTTNETPKIMKKFITTNS